MKTVGEILKTARKRKGLRRIEIARRTKINLKYIKALEKNDFGNLPETAFVKGFIRNYANAVGLDPEQALAVFRRDYDQDVKGQVIPRSLSPSSFPNSSLFTPKTTMAGVLGVVSLILVTYLVYQYRLLVSAPPLVVTSPKEEEHVKATITIVGKTDPQATVTINNQGITVTEDGSFSQSIILPLGTRTITVVANSRSGKVRTVQRTLYVEP